MGMNSVVVVLNDALDVIEKDPEFGAKLAGAVQYYPGRDRLDVLVSARAEGHGSFGAAATVLSVAHADYYQIVAVGRNTGYLIGDDHPDRKPSDGALMAVADALRRHGWRVSPPPKPKQPATDRGE